MDTIEDDWIVSSYSEFPSILHPTLLLSGVIFQTACTQALISGATFGGSQAKTLSKWGVILYIIPSCELLN